MAFKPPETALSIGSMGGTGSVSTPTGAGAGVASVGGAPPGGYGITQTGPNQYTGSGFGGVGGSGRRRSNYGQPSSGGGDYDTVTQTDYQRDSEGRVTSSTSTRSRVPRQGGFSGQFGQMDNRWGGSGNSFIGSGSSWSFGAGSGSPMAGRAGGTPQEIANRAAAWRQQRAGGGGFPVSGGRASGTAEDLKRMMPLGGSGGATGGSTNLTPAGPRHNTGTREALKQQKDDASFQRAIDAGRQPPVPVRRSPDFGNKLVDAAGQSHPGDLPASEGMGMRKTNPPDLPRSDKQPPTGAGPFSPPSKGQADLPRSDYISNPAERGRRLGQLRESEARQAEGKPASTSPSAADVMSGLYPEPPDEMRAPADPNATAPGGAKAGTQGGPVNPVQPGGSKVASVQGTGLPEGDYTGNDFPQMQAPWANSPSSQPSSPSGGGGSMTLPSAPSGGGSAGMGAVSVGSGVPFPKAPPQSGKGPTSSIRVDPSTGIPHNKWDMDWDAQDANTIGNTVGGVLGDVARMAMMGQSGSVPGSQLGAGAGNKPTENQFTPPGTFPKPNYGDIPGSSSPSSQPSSPSGGGSAGMGAVSVNSPPPAGAGQPTGGGAPGSNFNQAGTGPQFDPSELTQPSLNPATPPAGSGAMSLPGSSDALKAKLGLPTSGNTQFGGGDPFKPAGGSDLGTAGIGPAGGNDLGTASLEGSGPAQTYGNPPSEVAGFYGEAGGGSKIGPGFKSREGDVQYRYDPSIHAVRGQSDDWWETKDYGAARMLGGPGGAAALPESYVKPQQPGYGNQLGKPPAQQAGGAVGSGAVSVGDTLGGGMSDDDAYHAEVAQIRAGKNPYSKVGGEGGSGDAFFAASPDEKKPLSKDQLEMQYPALTGLGDTPSRGPGVLSMLPDLPSYPKQPEKTQPENKDSSIPVPDRGPARGEVGGAFFSGDQPGGELASVDMTSAASLDEPPPYSAPSKVGGEGGSGDAFFSGNKPASSVGGEGGSGDAFFGGQVGEAGHGGSSVGLTNRLPDIPNYGDDVGKLNPYETGERRGLGSFGPISAEWNQREFNAGREIGRSNIVTGPLWNLVDPPANTADVGAGERGRSALATIAGYPSRQLEGMGRWLGGLVGAGDLGASIGRNLSPTAGLRNLTGEPNPGLEGDTRRLEAGMDLATMFAGDLIPGPSNAERLAAQARAGREAAKAWYEAGAKVGDQYLRGASSIAGEAAAGTRAAEEAAASRLGSRLPETVDYKPPAGERLPTGNEPAYNNPLTGEYRAARPGDNPAYIERPSPSETPLMGRGDTVLEPRGSDMGMPGERLQSHHITGESPTYGLKPGEPNAGYKPDMEMPAAPAREAGTHHIMGPEGDTIGGSRIPAAERPAGAEAIRGESYLRSRGYDPARINAGEADAIISEMPKGWGEPGYFDSPSNWRNEPKIYGYKPEGYTPPVRTEPGFGTGTQSPFGNDIGLPGDIGTSVPRTGSSPERLAELAKAREAKTAGNALIDEMTGGAGAIKSPEDFLAAARRIQEQSRESIYGPRQGTTTNGGGGLTTNGKPVSTGGGDPLAGYIRGDSIEGPAVGSGLPREPAPRTTADFASDVRRLAADQEARAQAALREADSIRGGRPLSRLSPEEMDAYHNAKANAADAISRKDGYLRRASEIEGSQIAPPRDYDYRLGRQFNGKTGQYETIARDPATGGTGAGGSGGVTTNGRAPGGGGTGGASSAPLDAMWAEPWYNRPTWFTRGMDRVFNPYTMTGLNAMQSAQSVAGFVNNAPGTLNVISDLFGVNAALGLPKGVKQIFGKGTTSAGYADYMYNPSGSFREAMLKGTIGSANAAFSYEGLRRFYSNFVGGQEGVNSLAQQNREDAISNSNWRNGWKVALNDALTRAGLPPMFQLTGSPQYPIKTPEQRQAEQNQNNAINQYNAAQGMPTNLTGGKESAADRRARLAGQPFTGSLYGGGSRPNEAPPAPATGGAGSTPAGSKPVSSGIDWSRLPGALYDFATFNQLSNAVPVSGVHDADTMRVMDSNVIRRLYPSNDRTVRLSNSDAPELGQQGGQEAANFVKGLQGSKVVAPGIYSNTTDKYGRTISDIQYPWYAQGSGSIQRDIVGSGYSWNYPGLSTDPALAGLEQQARQQRRGIWAYPNNIPPWLWRARNAR